AVVDAAVATGDPRSATPTGLVKPIGTSLGVGNDNGPTTVPRPTPRHEPRQRPAARCRQAAWTGTTRVVNPHSPAISHHVRPRITIGGAGTSAAHGRPRLPSSGHAGGDWLRSAKPSPRWIRFADSAPVGFVLPTQRRLASFCQPAPAGFVRRPAPTGFVLPTR